MVGISIWKMRYPGKGSHPMIFAAAVALVIGLIGLPAHAFADTASRIAKCAKIEVDSLRLKCFDDLARASRSAAAEPKEKSGRATQGNEPRPQESVMSRNWDLDQETRDRPFAIRPHRANYILPFAYNSSPNRDFILTRDPDSKAKNAEAKFQISFKVKLWEDILGRDMDLWFAYTQLSFWQVYNKSFSSPFRENNYEPELLLNFRTDYDLLGLKGRIVNVGFNHQSNGRSEPLSRSWNRIVANFGFEKGDLGLLLKTWYRIPENSRDDDNPDIDKYLGYGELWGFYYHGGHRFSMMLRNNLRTRRNKGAVQVDWAFPIPYIDNDRIAGYLQYFNGYGESLIDYDKSVNRFGVGFMLRDW